MLLTSPRILLTAAICAVPATVGATVGVSVPASVAAWAGPIEDKQAEATRVISQLDRQASRVVALDTQHKRTSAQVARTEISLASAQAELQQAGHRHSAIRDRLVRRAIDAYVHGGVGPILEQLSRSSGPDLAVRRRYLEVAVGSDRDAVGALTAVQEDLKIRRQTLEGLRRQSRLAAERLRVDRAAVKRAIDAQKGALSRLRGEMAELVAAEQARRDAEAARRAAAAQKAATANRGDIGGPWGCIRQLESSNNYASPGGGAYQFTDDTWHDLGQSGTAGDAPPEVQDAMAVELQRRRGWAPWTTAAACGRS